MSYQTLLTSLEDGIFVITINRPEKLNALNKTVIEELSAAVDEVFQHFEKVTLIDSVTYKHSRQLGDRVIFFENVDSVGSKLAAQGLKQMKQEFSRKKL